MIKMAKCLASFAMATSLLLISMSGVPNLTLSAADYWATIQGYEGLTAGAAVPNDSNGLINYSGVTVTGNDNSAFVAAGLKSLKVVPTVAYPWFTIRGKQGDFVGDSFQLYIKFDGSTIQTSKLEAVFKNGGSETYSQLLTFKSLSGWVIIKYSDYSSIFTAATLPNLVGFKFSLNANSVKSPMYIDELKILNPVDAAAPAITNVEVTQTEDGTASVKWTAADDKTPGASLQSTLYYSSQPITVDMLQEIHIGTPNDKIQTVAVSAETTSQTVTGLDPHGTCYFAVSCTDLSGNTGYRVQDAFYRTLHGYEDLAPGAPVNSSSGLIGYSPSSSCTVSTDAAYVSGGTQSIVITPSSTEQYPWFKLKGDRGAFAGDGFRFHLMFGGENAPQISDAKALFNDGTGERTVQLWQFHTVTGWVTFKYSDYPSVFSEDTLDDLIGIQIAVNNRTYVGVPEYIDDLQVINPTDTAVRDVVHAIDTITPFTAAAVQQSYDSLSAEQKPSVHNSSALNLSEFRPQMLGVNVYLNKESSLYGAMAYRIENPTALSAAMAVEGYYIKEIGTVVYPTTNLGSQELSLTSPGDVGAAKAAFIDADAKDGYDIYQVILKTSLNHQFTLYSGRAYVTYTNGTEDITLYSQNSDAVTGTSNGVCSRTLNTTCRNVANQFLANGFYNDTITAANSQPNMFSTSKSLNTVWQYIQDYYVTNPI